MGSAASIEDLVVAEVAAEAYHPRTSKHSDSQSLIIIRDLIAECPLIAKRAGSGQLVAKLRHHQQVGHNDWVIDIALGSPSGTAEPPKNSELIRFTEPALIQIAIELKSIWTEHGKARRNRLRDFNAFHGYARQYSPKTVAAAFLVVNAADNFLSPLNLNKKGRSPITPHKRKSKTGAQVAKDAVDIFRSIHLRNSMSDPDGLEALGVIVVEHDNINYLDSFPKLAKLKQKFSSSRMPTRVAPIPPSLRVGDPLHYSTMIQRICNAYDDRFP